MHSKIIKLFAKIGLVVASILLPFFTFAQLQQPKNLSEFVNNFTFVLNSVIAFVVGFCFFGLVTGLLKYVGAGGDEERLGKAKQLIVYGLIGTFIAFSFWGLAKLLATTYLGV
jgi:hypothetical protein